MLIRVSAVLALIELSYLSDYLTSKSYAVEFLVMVGTGWLCVLFFCLATGYGVFIYRFHILLHSSHEVEP